MEIARLLTDLAAQGLRFTIDRDRLKVSPRAALTDNTRALIRTHKTALVEALRSSGTAELTNSADLQIVGASAARRGLELLLERPELQCAVGPAP
jgi:hypothetical protein